MTLFIWSIHLSSTLYSHSIIVVCIPLCLVSLFNLVVNPTLSLIFTLSIYGVMGISISLFVWTTAFSLCLCLVLDSLVLFVYRSSLILYWSENHFHLGMLNSVFFVFLPFSPFQSSGSIDPGSRFDHCSSHLHLFISYFSSRCSPG